MFSTAQKLHMFKNTYIAHNLALLISYWQQVQRLHAHNLCIFIQNEGLVSFT